MGKDYRAQALAEYRDLTQIEQQAIAGALFELLPKEEQEEILQKINEILERGTTLK